MYLMQSSTASVRCESMAETGFELAAGTAGAGCSWQGLLFMDIKCKARVTLSARCFRKLRGENCNRLRGGLNLHFPKDEPPFRPVPLLVEFCFSILCFAVVVIESEDWKKRLRIEREKLTREIKMN